MDDLVSTHRLLNLSAYIWGGTLLGLNFELIATDAVPTALPPIGEHFLLIFVALWLKGGEGGGV